MSLVKTENHASVCWIEHQMLEHIKGALRVTIDWRAPAVSMPRKRSSVSFTLQSFKRHLERLMSIEEEDGYLQDVAEEKPYLYDRVERLASEHRQFRARVRSLAPLLDELSDWQEDEFHEVCGEIAQLLDDIDHHDQEEVRLLQETMMMDDGGEG